MPVVPAIWEAEAGGSIEPQRLWLLRAWIAPLCSGLGDRMRPCLKKHETNIQKIFLPEHSCHSIPGLPTLLCSVKSCHQFSCDPLFTVGNSQIIHPYFWFRRENKGCNKSRCESQVGLLFLRPCFVAGHTQDKVTPRKILADKLGPILIPSRPSFIFGKRH